MINYNGVQTIEYRTVLATVPFVNTWLLVPYALVGLISGGNYLIYFHVGSCLLYIVMENYFV